ncbi:glycoside hydrolase family 18 protein [Neolentinus lepideus HHB14362 ss-1]|uniref:chitinase n=1 Tax=Neolentinus lepideus HHB14362 ss-1 TaxID=1314782 RepID=A0A165V2N0_9AGAM|nr:glycoside hydrolase family 18 protein [Neolentinus lepideus HHB14362 ss-1]
MVSLTFARIAALLYGPLCITAVLSAPVQESRDVPLATPAAPHWVIYTDEWVPNENGAPNTTEVQGYNVFILSFLLASGPSDQASSWASLTATERSQIKSSYAAAGIRLIVSAFGATETPTSSGTDPVSAANTMAAWVKKYDVDGIDVDYEDFDAINKGDGSAEKWLIEFTKQLRSHLPSGRYIVTHAPVAPWFRNDNYYGGGAYLKVHTEVGSNIDWYNVQFYNQGTTEYTTCDSLINHSSSTYPGSAVLEIAASGVNMSKIVIGKPAKASGDANNGYIDPSLLAKCLVMAKKQGWDAGVMVWEFPDAAADWIKTVRSRAWPE